MKTCLYIREGETVARAFNRPSRSKRATLDMIPDAEFAIVTGSDGEFAEWQIADLLKAIQANRKKP